MTPAEVDKLVRLATAYADQLDARGITGAGVVRALAGAVVTLSPSEAPAEGCQGCGEPIEQKPTGRPRAWCSDGCRNRARKRPKRGG